MPSLARSVSKPLKVPSLAGSVSEPLKMPSLARSVPKLYLAEAGGLQTWDYHRFRPLPAGCRQRGTSTDTLKFIVGSEVRVPTPQS